MSGHYQGGVLWFIVFVGGVVLFHRTYEKTFRDKLENMREDYKHQLSIKQDKGDGRQWPVEPSDKARMYADTISHVTTLLEHLSEPIQKEVNSCAILSLIILTAHVFLLVMPSLTAVPYFEPFHLDSDRWHTAAIIALYLACLWLSWKAFSTYRGLWQRIQFTAKYYAERWL